MTSRFKTLSRFGSAFALALGTLASSHVAAQTRTGDVVSIPTINGTTLIVGGEASFSGSALGGVSGKAGGAKILDGVVEISNATVGNVTNSPTHNGNTTIVSTGTTTLRAISVNGGATTKDLVNNTRRNGDLLVVAGGVEGSAGLLSRSAGTTGGVTVDSIRICGGSTGNVTNAGQVNGKATYVGGNVSANSVLIGCQ